MNNLLSISPLHINWKRYFAAGVCIFMLQAVPTLSKEATVKENATRVISSSEHTVELFVTEWCPYCKQAIAFLESRGISPTIYNIEHDLDAARRKKRLDPQEGVPFAIIDGHFVHGFSKKFYRLVLDGDL